MLNQKNYPLLEYIEALAITAGVAMFTLSEKVPSAAASARVDTTYGALLLALYLCCDSFTSQWQSRVFKKYQIDQFQVGVCVTV